MQIIKTLACILFFVAPAMVRAQSGFLQQGSKENVILERMEIKAQKDTVLNFSFLKPFNRQWLVSSLERVSSDSSGVNLTAIDRYNIHHALGNNLEWVSGDPTPYLSKKSLWNTFFQTPGDLVVVNQKDFFLSINPVLQLQARMESGNGDFLFLNSKGLVARGLIARRVGFQTYLTDNQERGPSFFQDRVRRYQAVPGAGYFKSFKGTGVDYFDARGSITFNIVKYLDLQFGYDKQFLGNGYRSLFLSEYPNSYLFFNLNLHVWRLNYVSKVMELTSQYRRGNDALLPKKYMAIHHISFNAPKWLTIGLFESIVFDRTDHFEFGYLNPIMFLRPMEQQLGSKDNALVGFDVKANIAKRFQLYTQVNFDEFILKEMKKGDGFWANKWAWQLGGKYVDAFGVKNLDLQAEVNMVRPFTYSHNDTIANYTHYNQPLAYPLMSNVREFIGIARYQPAPKWWIQGKLIAWQQGSDTAGHNFGNNIFLDNDTRYMDRGNRFGQAQALKGVNADLWVSYEWMENFFLEASLMVRRLTGSATSTMPSLGIRWNMHRREYDY
jgi:hypothetical protein